MEIDSFINAEDKSAIPTLPQDLDVEERKRIFTELCLMQDEIIEKKFVPLYKKSFEAHQSELFRQALNIAVQNFQAMHEETKTVFKSVPSQDYSVDALKAAKESGLDLRTAILELAAEIEAYEQEQTAIQN